MQFGPWLLCCSSSLTPAAAVLQLGALALSFSCAGEIILPLGGPAPPAHAVIRLHHSRTGSGVGGNGRGRTKRRVSPEPVYMLLRCLSVCAHATRPQHRSSVQDEESAATEPVTPARLLYVPASKSNSNKPNTSKEGLTRLTQPRIEFRRRLQQYLSATALIRNRRLPLLSYRQRLSLASTGDERETLRFDGDAGLLYVLFNVPKK